MFRLKKMLYRRLEKIQLKKIRKELDSYIDSRFSGEKEIPFAAASVSLEEQPIERKPMPCQSPPALPQSHSPKSALPQSTGRPTGKRAGKRSVPEFLSEREQRLDIEKILEQKEETFSNMLLRLIDEKGLKDSAVYKNANIDRRLFSKIRGDEDYTPSKKTAISFCLALKLKLNEARKLLEAAGYTLSASSRFDLIIMYLIEHREYNIHFANIVLDDYGEGTLSR
ncbi:MAG: hypothetical protein HFG80_08985 [Eubacterium sp.]|nr:hypothetical protein [Eubacterium sp.]